MNYGVYLLYSPHGLKLEHLCWQKGFSHWLPLLIIGNIHDSEYNVGSIHYIGITCTINCHIVRMITVANSPA